MMMMMMMMIRMMMMMGRNPVTFVGERLLIGVFTVTQTD